MQINPYPYRFRFYRLENSIYTGWKMHLKATQTEANKKTANKKLKGKSTQKAKMINIPTSSCSPEIQKHYSLMPANCSICLSLILIPLRISLTIALAYFFTDFSMTLACWDLTSVSFPKIESTISPPLTARIDNSVSLNCLFGVGLVSGVCHQGSKSDTYTVRALTTAL